MKKKLTFKVLPSKKNNEMKSSNLSGKKSSIYIYTEADLGEGSLDEGVNPSYYATSNENIEENNFQYKLAEVVNKNYGLEIVNVDDDFNYSYYL